MISIITPTYNRAKLLKRCYESLYIQTSNDFEWIIIDDGSEDNTEEIVRQFIDEGLVNIIYIKQKNQGKHVAHNTGVLNSSGELILCLDSDDFLDKDAIKYTNELWNKANKKDIIGILMPRGDVSRNRMCSEFPNIHTSTFFNLVHKYSFTGETALFFKSEILKNNLFKQFEGEKFLTEISLYYYIDKYGEMWLDNKILYYCEYQENGLTSNYQTLMYNNPKGAFYTYLLCYDRCDDFLQKIKYAIIANSFLHLANEKDFIYNDELYIKNKSIRLYSLFGYIYNKFKLKI